MAIQGSLESLSLPDLFSLLSQLRKTGVLSFVNGHEERGFIFSGGHVVCAMTREKERRLGMFLVRLGILDEEALTVEEEPKQGCEIYFGRRLLEAGKITAAELASAVHAQILDVVREVLAWKEGAFVFDECPSCLVIPDDSLVSTQSIILEAARMRDEDAYAQGLFPDFDVVLEQRGDAAGDDPLAEEVLSLVDGHRTLAQIFASTESPKTASRTLRDLADQGVVVATDVRPPPAAPAGIDDLRSVPVAPEVPARLYLTLTRDGSREDPIHGILAGEPMLTAKVLRALTLGNVEIRRSNMSVERLAELLGDLEARSLLLPEAVRGLFYPTHACYWDQLWEHTRTCAEVARFVAQEIGYSFPGEAYLAGLLHNLGAFILLQQDPRKYRSVVRESLETRRDIEVLETHRLGASHSDVGGEFAESWNFPRLLVRVIRFHHKVDSSTSNPLIHIVSVASGLAQARGYKVGFQSTMGVQFEDSLRRLKVDPQQAATLYAHVVRGSGTPGGELRTGSELERV